MRGSHGQFKETPANTETRTQIYSRASSRTNTNVGRWWKRNPSAASRNPNWYTQLDYLQSQLFQCRIYPTGVRKIIELLLFHKSHPVAFKWTSYLHTNHGNSSNQILKSNNLTHHNVHVINSVFTQHDLSEKWYYRMAVRAKCSSFFFFFLFSLPSPTYSLPVQKVTVAPDHTQWHTHMVGFLRTTDRPVAETSTWQHKRKDKHAPGGTRTRNPSKRPLITRRMHVPHVETLRLGKAIPVQAWAGPESHGRLRFPNGTWKW